MRISTSQWYAQSLGSMLSQQKSLTETQLQLASGKRILRPSDDPVAATRALDVSRTLGKLEQYGRNASQVQGRLMQEETALTSSLTQLQRARELTIQANTDSLSDSDREAIAKELHQLHDAVLQLANSRDGSGRYLFGGYAEDQAPYDASGNPVLDANGDPVASGQRRIDTGVSSNIADADPASSVFAYDGRDILADLKALATAVETSDRAAMASGITSMDGAIAQLSDVRTDIGARLQQLALQEDIRAESSLQLSGTLSDLQDLDYAEAISRFNQQLTGLQAAQQVFGKVQGLSLFNYL
ncbi:flagellar hook-associated protein FlgL [Amnimonas aquatica]|uniref:Flagellar hook-associated protein 3 n=1 Tax=Amnimonas aquatica TaxID=2094561 RepID=A0A2P6AU51_9GAMM|nr:flagellar hook-associated protein FlgL [Amnimonas aquatica]PQA48905.1 flagellar hook-associated protein 3 [Amnimonas aquatica]